MLRDVGGLLNLLTIFGMGIVYGLNFLIGDPLETYLAEGLLKMEKRRSGVVNDIESISQRKPFKLLSCICIRRDDKTRHIRRGIERVQRELDIQQVLKT